MRRAALPIHLYFDGLPKPVAEHRFASPRKWRFDLAWPAQMVAVEQEGGLWVYGRHNRPFSMIADMEKYNTAALLGWRVFRFTPQQIRSGQARKFVEKSLSVEDVRIARNEITFGSGR